MGIEEQIDRLIDLGEDIKSRLDLLVELASDHSADSSKMVVDELPKKWRILEPGEVVCSSDLVNAKSDFLSDPPNGPGWRPVDTSVGTSVCQDDPCVFARPVADEPAKEAEHPAGPMPDPGEGYRIVSKDPPEDLQPGDDFWFSAYAEWHKSFHATLGITSQSDALWFRRKIEPPKPPEPEYREPVLPADGGMECEFSEEGDFWSSGRLGGVRIGKGWFSTCGVCWRHCRIKKDA